MRTYDVNFAELGRQGRGHVGACWSEVDVQVGAPPFSSRAIGSRTCPGAAMIQRRTARAAIVPASAISVTGPLRSVRGRGARQSRQPTDAGTARFVGKGGRSNMCRHLWKMVHDEVA